MSAFLIKDCLDEARNFGKCLEAELVLSRVLSRSRESIFAHPDLALSEVEWHEYQRLFARVKAGESLAYVLGHKEFFGLDLKVDSRVLVPRPETEFLVEAVLELVRDLEAPRILDVGTGSGAIALALAHTLPQAQVWASDVSEDALAVARENAARLELERVIFEQSDLLEDLEWHSRELDVLVANLPYIGTEQFHFVEKAVKDYEPSVALFGGKDGLRLYAQLFEQISCSITGVKPRWILGEFGSFQREAMNELIGSFFPQALLTFHRDLAGLDRFFTLENL